MPNLTQSGATPASRLLIDESPLVLLPTLAVIIGDRRAIALQQIHYWLDLNRKAEMKSGKPFHFREGRWWTYNTYQQWHDNCFPFWTVRLIRKLFTELEGLGLVLSAQFDQSKGNSTKWYSIDYEKLNALEKKHRDHLSQNDGGVAESDIGVAESVSPYTETTSKTNDQETIKTKKSDASIAPRDWANFGGGKAMKVAEPITIPVQPPDGLDQRSRSAAAPRQKWNPDEHGLDTDKHGWLKLPSTPSVVAGRREKVSRAKAIAIRNTQLWLIEQDVRGIELSEDEDGVEWIEHLNDSEPLEDALDANGSLPLRLLRDLAYDQGLITQAEFNETLETFFWEEI